MALKLKEVVLRLLRMSEDRRKKGFQRAAPSANFLYEWASESQCQKFIPQYEQDDLILICRQNRPSSFSIMLIKTHSTIKLFR